METVRIDLYSDTQTRPSREMREAMAAAEVGDEQRREDPTTNRLQERVCELLGTEAALFLPTGTMANQISFRVHCRPGDEIIMERTAHARNFESGAPAALSGANAEIIEGQAGMFTARQLEAAIRGTDNHFPRSRVVVVEQTANVAGGTIWPLDQIEAVSAVGRRHGLAVHMDGARLFNAVVESNTPASEYAGHFDSLWVDFSKGLGAPVGAALAGSREFIERAWRFKHQFGGAMRQSGVIAAAALYALDHNIDRLADDHENARTLAKGLGAIEGITVEPVATNMVFFDVSGLGMTGEELVERTMEHGLRFSPMGPTRVRAVTHLDVSREQILEAVDIVGRIAAG
ncbi:MAG: threonine aldolase family protein [Spirochaetaceae bacterium]